MRFDMTKGQAAKYMVHFYAWNVDDTYFFHCLGEAEKMFERLKGKLTEGQVLSIWDMERDTRKAFYRA